MSVRLPEVERACDALEAEVAGAAPDPGAVWRIAGDPGTGRRTALDVLAERLRVRGLAPVVLAPPRQAPDAAPTALLQLGVGLRRAGLGNGQLERLTGRGGWTAKLREALASVEQHQDRLVLLCYRPESWPSLAPEDTAFAQRASELANSVLLLSRCRRVVAGDLPDLVRPRSTLTLRAGGVSGLEWGEALAPVARRLQVHAGEALARRTPLDLRLLVAVAALEGVEAATRLALGSFRPAEVVRQLRRALGAGADVRPLLELWGRLALVRGPVPAEQILELGANGLDGVRLELLQSCLLYPRGDDTWTLHDLLRASARAEPLLSDEERRLTHERLARWYTGAFNRLAASGDPRALEAQYEAFEHASQCGGELPDALEPLFVEQLELLGRRCSAAGHYDRAVEAFRAACAWDDDDDYAHHYLAFNLDVQGKAADEVEVHYGRARALNPRNPWWHSRFIRFLVTIGRTEEARHAWDDAVDRLNVREDVGADVLKELHLELVRLLLHREELEFARAVLEAVPPKARHDATYRLLERRLVALERARAGLGVVPLTIDPDEVWRRPPSELMARDERESPLRRWFPGRVEAVGPEAVSVRVGVKEGDEPPRAGLMELPPARFDAWSRDERAGELRPGRFVVLGVYGDEPEERTIIRVLPDEPFDDPLPRPFPDPRRYLRRLGAVRS
ncbi:MAG: hypothetical protein M9894_14245 [Planctomycetes bacterium]|nr:hypothetical protein [Planctomycetota bacterium]